ncbi:MAG: hypothetical protein QXY47_06120 [Thermoplasmata archaeon]
MDWNTSQPKGCGYQGKGKSKTMVAAGFSLRNYTLVATVQHNPALRERTHPKGCGYQGEFQHNGSRTAA